MILMETGGGEEGLFRDKEKGRKTEGNGIYVT